jgi:hypothetical protein
LRRQNDATEAADVIEIEFAAGAMHIVSVDRSTACSHRRRYSAERMQDWESLVATVSVQAPLSRSLFSTRSVDNRTCKKCGKIARLTILCHQSMSFAAMHDGF